MASEEGGFESLSHSPVPVLYYGCFPAQCGPDMNMFPTCFSYFLCLCVWGWGGEEHGSFRLLCGQTWIGSVPSQCLHPCAAARNRPGPGPSPVLSLWPQLLLYAQDAETDGPGTLGLGQAHTQGWQGNDMGDPGGVMLEWEKARVAVVGSDMVLGGDRVAGRRWIMGRCLGQMWKLAKLHASI